ncbi:MAG: hypothetical protein IJB68_05815 [Ruminococcus sp.]|nr:hypothetical protein [Ruminococcus sp.]
MVYDSDSFIRNIIEHSQRITAIIEATDFSNHSLNPNIILIPSLWNNVNDALVVWAMDTKPAYEEECRKMAEIILKRAGKLTGDAETHLASMKSLRTVYTSDFPEMEFNQKDCMVFLNAYDNFMYIFYTSCPRVQRTLDHFGADYRDICSMRENFLKNISGGAAVSSAIQPAPAEEKTIPAEIPQTDDTAELLRQILAETKKTNELLTKLLNR